MFLKLLCKCHVYFSVYGLFVVKFARGIPSLCCQKKCKSLSLCVFNFWMCANSVSILWVRRADDSSWGEFCFMGSTRTSKNVWKKVDENESYENYF